MADEIDAMIEREGFLLEQQLKVRKPVLAAKGTCHNCDEPLPERVLFCDVDCRDDYKLREHRRLGRHNL